MLGDALACIEDTEHIHVEHFVEVLRRQLQGWLDDRNASVGSKASDLAQLRLGLLNCLLHEFSVTYVTLVSLHLHTVFLRHLLSCLLSVGVRVVEDGYIRTCLSTCLGNGETNTTVTTSRDYSAIQFDFKDHVGCKEMRKKSTHWPPELALPPAPIQPYTPHTKASPPVCALSLCNNNTAVPGMLVWPCSSVMTSNNVRQADEVRAIIRINLL